VTDVATIGDWIKLSIPKITLLFWFFEVNMWESPIPTEVKSKTFGTFLRDSEADAATWISRSLTLTTYRDVGNLSVTPIPLIDVVDMPIAWVVPKPG
jgi:hypothetical protein